MPPTSNTQIENLTGVATKTQSWLDCRLAVCILIRQLAKQLREMTRKSNRVAAVGLGMRLTGTLAALGLGAAAVMTGGASLLVQGAVFSAGYGTVIVHVNECTRRLLETKLCKEAEKAWNTDRKGYDKVKNSCDQLNRSNIRSRHAQRLHTHIRLVLATQRKDGSQRGLERISEDVDGGSGRLIRELFLVKALSDFIRVVDHISSGDPCVMADRFELVAEALRRNVEDQQQKLCQLSGRYSGEDEEDGGFVE